MEKPYSFTLILSALSLSILSQCTSVVVDGTPPQGGAGGGAPLPTNSRADGLKTIATPGQRFTVSGKASHENLRTGASNLANYTIRYETTHDPGQIIATVSGHRIGLQWDAGQGAFVGGDASYTVRAYRSSTSASGQVALGSFVIDAYGAGAGPDDSYFAHTVHGLETPPGTIATSFGSATYSGPARLSVVHDVRATNGGNLAYGNGTGTARLNVDFTTGQVDGRMDITDDGTSTTGYNILPTRIYVNPTSISGNGFSSSLNVPRPADLGMAAVNTTGVSGKFYGANASDIGGSFSGSGTSGNGTAAAQFQGAFIGH